MSAPPPFHHLLAATRNNAVVRYCAGVVAVVAMLPGVAAAAEPGVVMVPLPSSALMGVILIGGIAAFARFPTGKRHHRRKRVTQ